jgi:hypothetical protein
MRLLTTLATAAFVVWVANRFAENVGPELWQAPVVAVREGLAEAVRNVAESDAEEASVARPRVELQTEQLDADLAQGSDPEPSHAVPAVAEPSLETSETEAPPELPPDAVSASVVAPLTRDEAERIRCRLERVMQLASAGGS